MATKQKRTTRKPKGKRNIDPLSAMALAQGTGVDTALFGKRGFRELTHRPGQRNPEDIELLNSLAPAPSIGHISFTPDGIERFYRDGYVYQAFSSTPVFQDGYRMGAVEGVANEVPRTVNPRRKQNFIDPVTALSVASAVQTLGLHKPFVNGYQKLTHRESTGEHGLSWGGWELAFNGWPKYIAAEFRGVYPPLVVTGDSEGILDRIEDSNDGWVLLKLVAPMEYQAVQGTDYVTSVEGQQVENPAKWKVCSRTNPKTGKKHFVIVNKSTGQEQGYFWNKRAAETALLSLAKRTFEVKTVTPPPNFTENPRRYNPSATANAVYEEFHGAPPAEILEIRETERVHGHLAGIGDLVCIVVKIAGGQKMGSKVELNAPDPAKSADSDIVRVGCNEDKNQLYFVGGDQSIDVRALGFRDSYTVTHDGEDFDATDLRDLMVIGEVHKLTYRTEKEFDKFEEIDYFHKVGEDTKIRPFLLYDTMNSTMKLAGGEYTIHAKGIVN